MGPMPHPGKRAAAEAALGWIERLPSGAVLGIGSGSTVDALVALLAARPGLVSGAVAASSATERQLEAAGIEVLDLNMTGELPLYVDGADEVDGQLRLIKGGGAALTREKIIAAASRRFVCIVDASKQVTRLGEFPLPIEVIPMARSHVARAIVRLGADPEYREGVVTDNGNVIIDCHEFDIDDPVMLEARLDAIAGVVTNGLFAARPADTLILGSDDGRAIVSGKSVADAS